jgi:hypothetical protein
MAKQELKEASRAISVVLNDPRVGQDQRDQLLKARRELERIARSGKVDKRRIYRIAEIIAKVLEDVVKQ